jgi:uncharacterized protein YebE (UPF0316 family)
MIDSNILLTGMLVFISRICDVSLGTMRTIITVQGKTVMAFVLAFFEVTLWILVAGTVIHQIRDQPILIVFYSFGYATGNVVGIMVERKLAFGVIILKVITRNAGAAIAETLRKFGQPVTVFIGEGMRGPVSELYIACRRRDLTWILCEVRTIDPKVFYVIEQARDISRILKPIHTPMGGWRAVSKRK